MVSLNISYIIVDGRPYLTDGYRPMKSSIYHNIGTTDSFSSTKMQTVVDARIRAPFGMVVSGPPQSGKTVFTIQLLDNLHRSVDRPFRRIYWFYGNNNRTINLLETAYKDILTTVKGLPDDITPCISTDGSHTLHIFDDLLRESSSSKQLLDLTSRQSSHNFVSWVLMLQDLFYKGKKDEAKSRPVDSTSEQSVMNPKSDVSTPVAPRRQIQRERRESQRCPDNLWDTDSWMLATKKKNKKKKKTGKPFSQWVYQ